MRRGSFCVLTCLLSAGILAACGGDDPLTDVSDASTGSSGGGLDAAPSSSSGSSSVDAAAGPSSSSGELDAGVDSDASSPGDAGADGGAAFGASCTDVNAPASACQAPNECRKINRDNDLACTHACERDDDCAAPLPDCTKMGFCARKN